MWPQVPSGGARLVVPVMSQVTPLSASAELWQKSRVHLERPGLFLSPQSQDVLHPQSLQGVAQEQSL